MRKQLLISIALLLVNFCYAQTDSSARKGPFYPYHSFHQIRSLKLTDNTPSIPPDWTFHKYNYRSRFIVYTSTYKGVVMYDNYRQEFTPVFDFNNNNFNNRTYHEMDTKGALVGGALNYLFYMLGRGDE